MIDDGSRCVTVIIQDSEFKHINFRATGVHQALASVAAICDRDQMVVFDNGGCLFQDKGTGGDPHPFRARGRRLPPQRPGP